MTPSWKRLSSALQHLNTWSIQELARGALLLSVLLRAAPITLSHIRPNVARQLETLR